MKYAITLFFALVSFISLAQFPVTESRTVEHLEYKMSREGFLVSKQILSYNASSSVVAGNTTLGNVDYDGTFAPTGYGLWMRNAYVQANKPGSFRLQIKPNLSGLSTDAGATSGVTIYDRNPIFVSKNGTATIPLNTDLLPMSRFTVVFMETLDGSDTTKLKVRVNIDGFETAYNRDKKAQKAILFIGTSISRGTGASYTNPYGAWPQIITQYFIGKGEKVEIINRSVSGGTSTMMVNAKNAGVHDVDPDAVSAVFIEHGMNDGPPPAITSAQQNTYSNNLKAEVDYCLGRYKKATIFLDGTSPAENNTRESNLAILRGLAQTLAGTYATNYPGRVVYVNTGNAFDRTVTTNFASTDTAGDRLHPSDVGHAAKAKVYTDYFDANSFKLP